MIDYWCNAFTPDRAPLWRRVIEQDGLGIRLGARGDDDFAAVDAMADRMTRLGFDTLILPVCPPRPHATLDEFAHYAARDHEMAQWSTIHVGRFAGMYGVDPTAGATGVVAAEAALASDWCVALHTHTHSWDHTFDDAAYDPFYELCADHGVPFVMQAGASGGHRVHELGHPAAIDGPATRFPTVDFVLSHTGAPWVSETIAAAAAHPNVVIGTATHPPRRWSAELLDFLLAAGRSKVLFGTGYPLTGHTHALAQLDALDLPADVRHDLVDGNARRVFTRLH